MNQACAFNQPPLTIEEHVVWRCLFPEYLLKHLTYPAIILADQYDSRLLSSLIGEKFDWDSFKIEQKSYSNLYAEETR